METIEGPHIFPPVATVSQPRRQIDLITENLAPSGGSPTATTPAGPGSRCRVIKSLATLKQTKSAPQSSPRSPTEGISIHTSSPEPPEVQNAAGTRSCRIKGAGPWLAKRLPQKKPANPPPPEAPVPGVKKPHTPAPDENYEKFLQARAKEEEASHRPGRRRKHLGGIWEKRGDH